MKAHVVSDPMTQMVRIWLYEHDPIGGTTRFVQMVDGGTWKWSEVATEASGADVAPTFTLHQMWADAFASALAGMGSPEEATKRHLDDALKVRDRLLTIVEKS